MDWVLTNGSVSLFVHFFNLQERLDLMFMLFHENVCVGNLAQANEESLHVPFLSHSSDIFQDDTLVKSTSSYFRVPLAKSPLHVYSNTIKDPTQNITDSCQK